MLKITNNVMKENQSLHQQINMLRAQASVFGQGKKL
jgi:hypothetical protein